MTEPLPVVPLDPGPPWAKITPARWWGYFVTFGSSPLSETVIGPGGAPKQWWRRTRVGAEHKAQRLIDKEWDRRRSADAGWTYEPK